MLYVVLICPNNVVIFNELSLLIQQQLIILITVCVTNGRSNPFFSNGDFRLLTSISTLA